MTEEQAKNVAAALGGDSWQSGGGIWLVLLRRSDGRLVVDSGMRSVNTKTRQPLTPAAPRGRF